MALTRKLLRGMGLTDEQVDTIIEAHSDTVEALKSERDAAKDSVKELESVQKELNGLKASQSAQEDWKKKHDDLKKDYESYKSGIDAEKAKASKASAVRAYFESKGIKGKNLDLAMKASAEEINSAELDGEKIKDTAPFEVLVSGALSGLVESQRERGAQVGNPPGNSNSGGVKTKEEIMKIKDTTERQAAWADLIVSQQKGG